MKKKIAAMAMGILLMAGIIAMPVMASAPYDGSDEGGYTESSYTEEYASEDREEGTEGTNGEDSQEGSDTGEAAEGSADGTDSSSAEDSDSGESSSRIVGDINEGAETIDETGAADETGDDSLTPSGNMTLVDDITTSSGKQFYTMTTKDGQYFYLIIDKSNTTGANNVYFLNQVDERDLMSLMSDDEVAELEEEQAALESEKEAAEPSAEQEETESTAVSAETQAEAAADTGSGTGTISFPGANLSPEMDMAIAVGCFNKSPSAVKYGC